MLVRIPMSTVGPGYVIGGKYQVVTLLGRGSMGEVWLAHHLSLGEQVALKLLAAQSEAGGIEDPVTASARFRFEARVAARLSRRTRHIVRVTDHGEDPALSYLAMELLEGRTLERRLALFGEMQPAEVSQLVAQIARALECAHAEHVVHRDLKPANLFLARDEDGALLVKVLDFGIARATRTQTLAAPFATGGGVVFGTPGYMGPEQAFGWAIDTRADLWALATVAYEALTGTLPLSGTSVQELQRNLLLRQFVPIHARNPALPAPLAAFFERAFAPRVEDRFASASQLASAFEQALVVRRGTLDRTVRIPPAAVPAGDTLPVALDAPPRSRRSSERRRTARVPALAAVLGLAAVIAGRVVHTPAFGSVAPASSTESAPTRAAGSTAIAPAPEAGLPDEISPSGPGVAPHASEPVAGSGIRRATAAEGARPVAGASDVPKQTSRPVGSSAVPVPPSGAPVSPSPVVPPPRKTDADKSATL